MLNIVVHFKNRAMLKGTTANFFPQRPSFHLVTSAGVATEVQISELKAIFFVKSFAGDPSHKESQDFPQQGGAGMGRKARVVCNDGEVLAGFCPSYRKDLKGFFLFPADKNSNNERIFVVADSVKNVEMS
jgi:hypothetical protein